MKIFVLMPGLKEGGEFFCEMNLGLFFLQTYHICIKCLDICNIYPKCLKKSSLNSLFLAVFRRGATVGLPETPGEVGGVIKSNLVANVRDAGITRLQ